MIAFQSLKKARTSFIFSSDKKKKLPQKVKIKKIRKNLCERERKKIERNFPDDIRRRSKKQQGCV